MANEIKTINDIFLCDVTARADIAKIVENYASKVYVDDKLSNLDANINLESYATKTYVKQLVSNSETRVTASLSKYALKTDLTGLATESFVKSEISNAQLGNNGGNEGTNPNLSNYVLKSELEDALYISYYDIYLQDENGEYLQDENGEFMIENFASYNSVQKLKEQVTALTELVNSLKSRIEELEK